MTYWFRPKRFWKWFAFYVPTSISGLLSTLIILLVAVKIFIIIDLTSSSGTDTLLRFAPWAIALMLFFDLLCFRFGEYPSWWRKKER